MEELRSIVTHLNKLGAICYLVGGAVRDQVLGLEPKDLDVEVYGLKSELVVAALEEFGSVDLVGSSFGIIKLKTLFNEYDFSLPRRESKSGKGHKGFIVEADPTMSPLEAASRRDFTINSMMQNVLTGEIIDPFNGIQDLNDHRLSITSEAFREDPLRVLRGFQFCSRFSLTPDLKTIQTCRLMIDEFDELPIERVWVEWEKWALKAVSPAHGLRFLLSSGWITKFRELNALRGTQQDPEWHPEGDVWTHTCLVVEEAVRICERENITGFQRLVIVFAALCHDLAKPSTTTFTDGRWRSHGHEAKGEKYTIRFLESIGAPNKLIEHVVPLVVSHLVHCNEMSTRAVRRLANRIQPATIQDLVYVIEADHSGRSPLPKGIPENAQKMLDLSRQLCLTVEGPKPIVGGKLLISLGVKPGKEMGALIDQMFERQLDEEFSTVEEATEILRKEVL